MAYVTKYYLQHISNNGIPYYVQLQRDGFTGDPSRLYFADGGLEISNQLGAWEDSIQTSVAKMSILNDNADFYEYEDLFTLEDKEYKVRVDASYNGVNKTVFDGWINSSPVSQNYYNNSIINLTGSNFISRMDKLTPYILNSTDASDGDAKSMIDLINSSLQLTGKRDDIYVNNRLEPSAGLIGNTTTMFNRAALNPQLFWDDNENKQSGSDIIKSILSPFNCYLYWYDSNWYIERYRDLFPSNFQKKYVKYNVDSSYGFDSTGTYLLTTDASYVLPVSECNSGMVFTGSSQTISMIPGLEFLEITLDEAPTLNLTINDFSNIERHYSPSLQYPEYKGWCATSYNYTGSASHDFPGYIADGVDTDCSIGYGFVKTGIIKYPSAPPCSTPITGKLGPGDAFSGIDNALIRFGAPMYIYNSGADEKWDPTVAGFSTRIKYTIKSEEAKLNFSWKFKPMHINECSSVEIDVRSYDYKCHYMMRPLESGIGGAIWIMHNEDYDYWYKAASSVFDTYAQTVIINGADLDDYGVGEIKVEIPIGDVSGYLPNGGDGEMIFIIGMEKIKKSSDSNWRSWVFGDRHSGSYICDQPLASQQPQFCLMAAYGDVQITADDGGEDEDTKILCQINSNVANTQKVTFNVFDTSSLSLDNGPRTGGLPYNRYSERTTLWAEEDDNTVWRSIVDWYIHDRFQLYYRNRREIHGTLRYPGYLKPMSMWYDEYDPSTRRYILSSYTYNIGRDTYNCTWMEYDDSETISLSARQDGRPARTSIPSSGRTSRTSTRTTTTTTRSTTGSSGSGSTSEAPIQKPGKGDSTQPYYMQY